MIIIVDVLLSLIWHGSYLPQHGCAQLLHALLDLERPLLLSGNFLLLFMKLHSIVVSSPRML